MQMCHLACRDKPSKKEKDLGTEEDIRGHVVVLLRETKRDKHQVDHVLTSNVAPFLSQGILKSVALNHSVFLFESVF